MQLKDYLEEIEQTKQKALIYKELKDYLQKFLKSDTAEAEMVIPIGAGSLGTSTMEYDKFVPEHLIAQVLSEVETAQEELETELKLKLEQTIGQ